MSNLQLKKSESFETLQDTSKITYLMTEVLNDSTKSNIEEFSENIFDLNLFIENICIKHELKNIDKKIIKEKLQEINYDVNKIHYFCNSLVDLSDICFEYNKLAVIILVKILHKFVPSFHKMCDILTKEEVMKLEFNKLIQSRDYIYNKKRDYNFDYFGLMTLLGKTYLNHLIKYEVPVNNFNITNNIFNSCIETPQYLFLRTAIQIWKNNEDKINLTYELLSNKYIMHASPTLFNSCARKNQLSSCFLIDLIEDSMHGIYMTDYLIAMVSQSGGGIGLNLSCLRSSYSPIKSSQNLCKGIKQWLKTYQRTIKNVDQSGRRDGAMAIYFEPWHPEIEEILEMKKSSKIKTFKLFYALMISDLFMKRVINNEVWSLFDTECAYVLNTTYGSEFEEKYIQFEKEAKYVKQINAADLFDKILYTQINNGDPYIFYKDTINYLSSQKNIGIIKQSNLCAEIMEVSNKNEIGVCNLASVNLSECISDEILSQYEYESEDENVLFDFEMLCYLVKNLVRNLNKVIDNTYYSVNEAKKNLNHRPIGIGIQGLANVFFKMMIPYDSDKARELNIKIIETIYYSALEESNKIAKEDTNVVYRNILPYIPVNYRSTFQTGAYSTFSGSPLSNGQFHFDLYSEIKEKLPGYKKPQYTLDYIKNKSTKDWEKLRKNIQIYGVKNSLFVALMPTASTAQITGSYESFEPMYTNMHVRKTQTGMYKVPNLYLQKLLTKRNKWDKKLINSIYENNGSVQHLTCLTEYEKKVFKTVWEIDPEKYIQLSTDRVPFVDQSESMSIFLNKPTKKQLGKLHFKTWFNMHKTGMYYLRMNVSANKVEETNSCQMCTS